jgi:hypothetical protein
MARLHDVHIAEGIGRQRAVEEEPGAQFAVVLSLWVRSIGLDGMSRHPGWPENRENREMTDLCTNDREWTFYCRARDDSATLRAHRRKKARRDEQSKKKQERRRKQQAPHESNLARLLSAWLPTFGSTWSCVRAARGEAADDSMYREEAAVGIS